MNYDMFTQTRGSHRQQWRWRQNVGVSNDKSSVRNVNFMQMRSDFHERAGRGFTRPVSSAGKTEEFEDDFTVLYDLTVTTYIHGW